MMGVTALSDPASAKLNLSGTKDYICDCVGRLCACACGFGVCAYAWVCVYINLTELSPVAALLRCPAAPPACAAVKL